MTKPVNTEHAMSAHTPGPWAVGEGGQHVYYVNPAIEAGDEGIDDPRHDSIVARCGDMGAFSGIPDSEIDANARLIAAAPELLATLIGVRAFCPVFVQDDIDKLIAKAVA